MKKYYVSNNENPNTKGSMKMYIKEILEKINNMEFTQDYEGKENKITVKVVENENDDNVQITIDCDSWIGHNCIFNETYEYDDSIEKFFQDLHEQNLEDIENEIYDNVTPTQEELFNYILTALDYEDITEEQKEGK